jgi:thiamine biosynthesis lipoprotein
MNRRAQPWLGTLVEITIADPLGESELHVGFNAAFLAIAQVHRLMSFHDPASDVSRINRARAGETVEVNLATHFVIRNALSLWEASCGIFDIACASKLVEWGYLPSVPETADMPVQKMLALDESNRIRKLTAGAIDLGGIAKGYAVDAAIDALERMNIRSACVNAGGDLRVLGASPFEILIRDPRNPVLTATRIPIRHGALATSGAYFTRRTCDNESRSTLIDGRSGAAVTRDFSVSVQAHECMTADALTKIVAATGDPHHPLLARYRAAAFII